jgi:uncharacterized protein
VTAVHHLSRQEARRLAVRAQLLTAQRPGDLMQVVRRLTLLQNDPTAAVAPNADLVLWSRLGNSYSPDDLRAEVEAQRLLELHLLIRPAEDLALYRADMADWPGRGRLRPWQRDLAAWVGANNACRLDILDRLRQDGPLPVTELPDTCVRPWRSSGWNNNKNVQQLVAILVDRGEVALAGREGAHRLWDLASRIYPDDPLLPADEAEVERNRRRLASLGIARARGTKTPSEPNIVGEVGEPAVVDGVAGEWRIDPALLDQPFSGRTALLSPLDRLVYDRKRLDELFDFDYTLEMYKPAAQRLWGYWALPILHGDRLVGKLDATADRRSGELIVHAVHEDEPFRPAVAAGVRREIADLARWLELEVVLPG